MTTPSGSARALCAHYPLQSLVVSAALIGSTILLIKGLSLPLLYTQQMVFWKSTYSVWTGIVALWHVNELLLAGVLFFFSIVFPFTKLTALSVLWFIPMPENQRCLILHWLGILGKWSMLDVFVVAILIVLVKLGPMAKVEPREGVYFFAGAILASMITTMYVDSLARSATTPPSETKHFDL